MSDEYQLRKDIDKVLDLASDLQDVSDRNNVSSLNELLELYPDISQLESLSAHMTQLSTNLYSLKDSLIEFNRELISFDDDNTNFAENLAKLKENLAFVLRDVDNLRQDSSDFNDALDEFGVDIDEFVETLMGLNDDLNILSDYILTFEGDLSDFQAELIAHGIDTSVLSTDMGKLIQAMAKVRSRTTDAEDDIDKLKDDIGTGDSSEVDGQGRPTTIKRWIQWLKGEIGDENSGLVKDINDLEAIIGEDDPTNPTGIFANIKTAQNHIIKINNYIYGTGGSESDLKSDGILYKINNTLASISDVNIDLYGYADGNPTNKYTSNSIWGKIKSAESEISTINGKIGSNTSGSETGLYLSIKNATDNISEINTKIGSSTSGSESGLYLLIKNATDSITNITTNIIGSNTQGHESGLYLLIKNATDSIATINGKIGSNTSGSESGLYLLIKNATDSISTINTKIGSNTSGSESGLYLAIKNAMDNISSINTKIGSNTSGSESGIYLALKNLTDSISDAEEQLDNDDPTNLGVLQRISALITRVTNAEDSIGTVDVATDGDLQTQVTTITPYVEVIYSSPITVNIGETTTLVVVPTLRGIHEVDDGGELNILHIFPDGTTEDITLTEEDFSILFFTKTVTLQDVGIHEFIGDYCIHTVQVGKSDHWIEYDLNSNVFSLYYNPALRLCELRMVYQISGSASGTGEHNVTTPTIPSTYRPSANVIGTLNRGGGSIRVDSDGKIYWITAVTQSVGTYLYGSVMWHY